MMSIWGKGLRMKNHRQIEAVHSQKFQ